MRGHQLLVRLEGGDHLTLRRFAPIGRGDRIFRVGGGIRVELGSGDCSVPLTPAWSTDRSLSGCGDLPVTLKEIETQDELRGFDRLTQYHYRGSGGAGRRVPLIAVVDQWELPPVVGFLELSSSFLVNSARDSALNTRFSDPDRGIGWTKWDAQTARKFGNIVVRISRCVVFPELRGVGLAHLLLDAAIDFARQRWHIGGLRPSFIEITAEMLRYWPFVERAGFIYVGDTEGNSHRVEKDMRYLLGRALKARDLPQGGGGILSLQRSNAMLLHGLIKDRGMTLDGVLQHLKRSPEKLSDETWVQLHRVFRRPKPTYMYGLTQSAQALVRRRSAAKPNKRSAESEQNPAIQLVQIEDLQLGVAVKPERSWRARRVQEAFGIVATSFDSVLISDLCLNLTAGDLLLIGGPSGSGKSLLLRAIRHLCASGSARGRLPREVTLRGRLLSRKLSVAWLRPLPPKRSPIELLSQLSLERALQLLASAGLAEAQLFVRPTRTLSLGQAYRLQIALALSEEPDLLIIDEFCEPLDRFTTVAVCRKIHRRGRSDEMAVIVATADPEKVVRTLQPTHTLLLSSSGQHMWAKTPRENECSEQEK